MPETLFLTTNLIDRFLELKGVTRKNLQLVRTCTQVAPDPRPAMLSRHQQPAAGPSPTVLFGHQQTCCSSKAHRLIRHAQSCHCPIRDRAADTCSMRICPPTLQVGVTAMLIASKYEEIWAPELNDFVYISDRAYKKEQILTMEKVMLNALKFNLTGVCASSACSM
jgi:Cyclin, N-terminal domain